MSKRFTFSVLALFFLLEGECFSAPVDLDGLKAGFERKTEEVLKPLVERHTGFLLTLERMLAQRDSLEDALLVREERVRIALEKGMNPLIELPNTPPQLVALSSRFRREALSFMRPWENKYDKALVDLLRQLQRAAKLEDALRTKKELEVFRAKIKLRDNAKEGNSDGAENDFALASAGATAQAPNRAGDLIDGKIVHEATATGGIGYAWGVCPSSFIVDLSRLQKISKIRFLLYNNKDERRRYKYQLFISPHEDDDWEMIADRSEKPSHGWQEHKFNPRMVRKIKVIGLHNTTNKNFHIVEIEAR